MESVTDKIFDEIIQKINEKKEYFQKFYECEGNSKQDEELNKVTQFAFDDCIQIVNDIKAKYGKFPKKKNLTSFHANEISKMTKNAFEHGWNACIDEILKGSD